MHPEQALKKILNSSFEILFGLSMRNKTAK